MCDHVAPTAAILHGSDRRFDDAEVSRFPVATDDEPIAEILKLILVITLAWQRYLE